MGGEVLGGESPKSNSHLDGAATLMHPHLLSMPGNTGGAEKPTLAHVTMSHLALPVPLAPLGAGGTRRKTQTLPLRRARVSWGD